MNKSQKGNQPMTELRLLQLLQLSALKEIDRVCSVMNLNYYCIAGTLLGAFRHGGFIPWDTDADVGMHREHYEKFVRYGNEVIGPNFVIQSDYNDAKNRTCFARIRIKDTLFNEIDNAKVHEFSGLYVDVFPLDIVDSYPSKMKLLYHRLFKVLVRVKAFRAGKVKSSTKFRSFIGLSLNFLFSILSTPQLNRLIDASIGVNGRSAGDLVTNYNSKYGLVKQTMPISIYGDTKIKIFDGLLLKIPEHAEEWLQRIYGNYMRVPESPALELDSLLQGYEVNFGKYNYLLSVKEAEAREALGLPIS